VTLVGADELDWGVDEGDEARGVGGLAGEGGLEAVEEGRSCCANGSCGVVEGLRVVDDRAVCGAQVAQERWGDLHCVLIYRRR